MIRLAEASLMRTRPLRPRAAAVAVVLLSITVGGISSGRAENAASTGQAPQTWTCRYIAATPDGPLQITAKFQVVGDELAEVETIPSGLNFSEKYKINAQRCTWARRHSSSKTGVNALSAPLTTRRWPA
jgi:hypothetical protein